jgi:ketopantoate reductase
MRPRASSNKNDWAPRCAEIAHGGLSALAAAADGELARDPSLRRLLKAVAKEASGAAASAGLRVTGNPALLALDWCRRHPNHRHPWQNALRQGRKTGAAAAFEPLLKAARRKNTPAPKLAIIGEVLRRLDRKRK